MSVFKCKMCGGDLQITSDSTVYECEYCGSRQTVPTADDEKKMNLFARAGKMLRGCEFDKAEAIFENIIADFPTEAEAYWGLVLCKFGIEYVDDPATGKKVPTCHRSGFESVMDDKDFELACDNADGIARRLYREEAKQIEELRKRIMEVSGKEEPYDIFICYKETAEDGWRTPDSVLAQDIYEKLTDAGYRVFFARITLEDKLGQEYEPYIFAALNSAKIMLVFGTDYDYFNAVWVKNEWSRYLRLMAGDKQKRLIPCYRDIDAYDMPKEFRNLQAQDMGKVGADQDLIRAIKKLLPKEEAKNAQQTVVQQVVQGGPSAASYLKRATLFLGDGDWTSANEYADKALDIDPENAEGYLVKLLVKYRQRNEEGIADIIADTAALPEGKKLIRLVSYARGKKLDAMKAASAALGMSLNEAGTFADTLPRDVAVADEQYNMLAGAFETDTLSADPRDGIKSDPNYQKFIRFAPPDRAEKVRAIEQKGRELYAERLRRSSEEAEARRKALEETRLWLRSVRERLAKARNMIGACCNHTVALKSDGTVVAAGNNYLGKCDVLGWKDIVAVAAGYDHTMGMRADGTVVAIGYSFNGECSLAGRNDIKAFSLHRHTVGLRRDGTVIAVGVNTSGQCNVSEWKDIVEVAAGRDHTIGLKSDGTVVAVGKNDYNQCGGAAGWKDIVAVAAGRDHTVGLRSDGTVVACGAESRDQCNVSGWKDIVAISAGSRFTVGLKANGTVVAVGANDKSQCNVFDWKDIVAVSAGEDYTVGLCSDGTVVAVGNNDKGQRNVSGLKLFDSMDTLEKKRIAAAVPAAMGNAERKRMEAELRAKQERERKYQQLRSSLSAAQGKKAAAEAELSNLKGLFAGRRKKELEAVIAEQQRMITETAIQLNKLG